MLSVSVLVAAMATLVAADYPAYCAKDMNANKIQPLDQPAASALKLVQVQVVVRHGARTPWSTKICWDGYNEEWNCNIHELQRPELKTPTQTLVTSHEFEKVYTRGDNIFPGTCNLGQMIDEGYQQQTLNGQHLREAYVGPKGLFQSTDGLDLTNTSDFHFESSDIPRTINSGMIIVDQIFPSGKNDSTTSSTPIPWHTSDYSRNIVTPNAAVCPKLNWIDAQWRQSPEFVSWLASEANAKLEHDLQRVVKNYDHSTLYDCFMTAKCTDRKLPDGIDDDLFNRTTRREESVQIQQYLFNNSAYARTGMSPYIKRIRDRVINAKQSAAPRFVLSAAHDTTIMPLLAALGGSQWLKEWVPYASHMIFELYANKTDHYVRILFQGKPLSVPGCVNELCSFDAFLELTKFSADPSICTPPSVSLRGPPAQVTSTGTETSSPSNWTWAYGIVGILVGTLLGYFAGVNSPFKERNGYSALPNSN